MRIVCQLMSPPVSDALSLPDGVRSTAQRLAVLRAVGEAPGSFTVAELHDRAPLRARPRARDHVPDARAPAGERRRPPAARRGPPHLRPLPPRAPPSPGLHELRRRRGDRALRGALGGAPAPARLPARRARAGHLRHLQALRVNWIAIPLAGLTVLSTLAGGVVALRLARSSRPRSRSPAAWSSRWRSSTSCRRRSRRSVTRIASGCSWASASSSPSSQSGRSCSTTATTTSMSTPTPRSARSVPPASRSTASSTGSGSESPSASRPRRACSSSSPCSPMTSRTASTRSGSSCASRRPRAGDPVARRRRGCSARRGDRRLHALDLRGRPRRAAGRLRRLLPLHGCHRPPPARPPAPVGEARRPDARRLRRDLPRQPDRPGVAGRARRSRG